MNMGNNSAGRGRGGGNTNLQNRLRGTTAEVGYSDNANKLACVFRKYRGIFFSKCYKNQLTFFKFCPGRNCPKGGDASFLRCILETTNLTVRKSLGLKMADAKHIALMVRWVLLKMTQADLQMLRHGDLSFEDIELLKLSCRLLAHATSKSAKTKESPTSVEQIFNIKRTIAAIEKVIRQHEEVRAKQNSGNSDTPPELKLYSNSIDGQNAIKNYNFGRFRRDGYDVEHLCGDSNKPPIFRPIQLTLVQDRGNRLAMLRRA